MNYSKVVIQKEYDSRDIYIYYIIIYKIIITHIIASAILANAKFGNLILKKFDNLIVT